MDFEHTIDVNAITDIEEVINNITVLRDSENKLKIVWEPTLCPIKFLLAPPEGGKIGQDGQYCFGLKQRPDGKNSSIGISLVNQISTACKFFIHLREKIQNKLVDGQVMDLVSTGKDGTKAPVLNVWLNQYKTQLKSEFFFIGSETKIENPFQELSNGFKGVYYLDLTGISQSKSDPSKWYPNMQLDTCIAQKKPKLDLNRWKD